MNERNSLHREYDFSLILSGVQELTSDIEDALFEAGCDDSTLSIQHGIVCMQFTREALSLKDAILSAIEDIRNANIGADVLRVDECSLVTPSEIARRIGRSRQLVHQYTTGQRGPGNFPAPERNLGDRAAPLWDWYAVSYWLSQNNMIRLEDHQNAETIAAVNHALEGLHQRSRNPALVDEVQRAIAKV